MSGPWRTFALVASLALLACGLILWATTGGWPVAIVGLFVVLTVLAERSYGGLSGRAPIGGDWRATDEKFIDPESGKLVTVWFNPASGERRYIADKGDLA